ncbi:Protein CBR-LIN-22 [Caenorhabditis briggsae]|uniref:BHLH domain-containing protein n=2 Tax=Caenorhabditis briggsae TaxID=6238 RepID=A0AAE9EXW3_CAEBR|nr:Protein CBR-LIN-22 [Caenorhabditis briggsae]ULT95844.1 hypothetical protein L3Y34_004482 [Caenorhabditis briggsae]UMM29047.1 hypothetical protein L5515_011601 [Caenorhabditis briggsae]CAP24266.1 Protein CBR-LIN-22 [Caenorhabditis briggsae]
MSSFVISDTDAESDGGCRQQKKNKPLMEKKRRARINKSLSQLKQILIQDGHKNSAQHSKWEKADILEMTVEYLQQLRSSQNCLSSPSTSSVPTPTQPPTPPEEKIPCVHMSQMVPFMNPFMHQYAAYQQLAQLSIYSQLFGQQVGFKTMESKPISESLNTNQGK